MRIRKAVITAAGRQQRNLPLQTLIDRDGQEKSVLTILVDEALRAKAEEICVVIAPGDGEAYRRAAADHASGLRFVEQDEPAGYGHAIWCSRDFTKDEPFLHLVADHVFVGSGEESCASAVVQAAESQECSVSAVQPTREGLLAQFGAIGGHALADADELFQVETVLEKPTPTEAEQRLIVPGLRAGHYLCYFGLHVLTPTVMEILGENIREGRRRISLSELGCPVAARTVSRATDAGTAIRPGHAVWPADRAGRLRAQRPGPRRGSCAAGGVAGCP